MHFNLLFTFVGGRYLIVGTPNIFAAGPAKAVMSLNVSQDVYKATKLCSDFISRDLVLILSQYLSA